MTKNSIPLTDEQIDMCMYIMDNKLSMPSEYYYLLYDILNNVVDAAATGADITVQKIELVEIIEEEVISDNVIFGWDFLNRVRLQC